MAAYWIVGSDGRTYGPVDLATMQRWITEARVVATTQVGTSEQGPWTDATLVPELAGAFGEEPATPHAAGPGTAAPPPPAQPACEECGQGVGTRRAASRTGWAASRLG